MNFYKNTMVALSALLAAFAVSNAAVGDTIRVNSGATAPYTDAAGHIWAADSGFTGGQTYSATSDIANTPDPALHQDERYDSQDFGYNFNVTPGSYIVGLYEATLYDGACGEGTRIFDVTINGTKVLTDYDMSKEVGCLTAQIKRFVVATTDGKINITFNLGSVQNPKINAIEIYPGTVVGIQGQGQGKVNAGDSKLSIVAAQGGFSVKTQTEGAYTLELSNLQGQRLSQKSGFGSGSQSFSNLKPGLYFLTSHVGHQVFTRTVSVIR